MMIHQQAAAQKLGELFLEARNFRDHWKHVSNGKSPNVHYWDARMSAFRDSARGLGVIVLFNKFIEKS